MTTVNRSGLVALAAPAFLFVFGIGCTTPAAYGLSGDERLEMAVEGRSDEGASANTQQLAELHGYACADLAGQIESLRSLPTSGAMMDGDAEAEANAPNLEEDHLATLTGSVRELRRRRDSIGDILMNSPDLRFFSGPAADGRSYDIPEMTRVCEMVLQDAEIVLDGFIRELLSMPIISDVERVGRRVVTVPRERVDFALLAVAIEVLSPFDADSLMGRVEAARSRLEEEKAQASSPPGRRR